MTDGYRDHRESVPRAFVGLVIIVGIRNKASFLAGKVHSELISKSHRDHIVLPARHGFLDIVVFLPVAKHVV